MKCSQKIANFVYMFPLTFVLHFDGKEFLSFLLLRQKNFIMLYPQVVYISNNVTNIKYDRVYNGIQF